MSPPPALPGLTVLNEVARGGQGVVYRARHDASGAIVALKLLLDPEPRLVQRFEQEARVMAALPHPNLPRVFGAGHHDGAPYLAIEFVQGENLAQLVARGGTPPAAWIGRVLATVAHTLQFCHEHGIVHRDLKPANVLVEAATQRPVLVDFGLVKRDPHQLHLEGMEGPVLSLSGAIKGTPEYMAPEQVNPKTFGEVDPRTDVYALGATLYHLLTGGPPFTGRVPVVVMRKVTRKAPRDPREVNPAAPAALAALAVSCLAKQRDQRPASAAAFAAQVAHAAGIAPLRDPRPAGHRVDPSLHEVLSSSAHETVDAGPRARTRLAGLPAHLPTTGAQFAGYTLERQLARGGGGAVFVARSIASGAPVAIKLLLGDPLDDTKAERFRREFAAGREVDHPNVVRLLDHGVSDGVAYLTLELLEGAQPLDRFADDRNLPVGDRLRLLQQLAEGVQAAHDAGLVHRDLKPDNVLVLPSGRVKVLDFGLARHLDKTRLTLSGQVMGTVSYMAPEQVRGDTAHADARADVYALGVILYRLLTGALPFTGDTNLEVMAAILEDPAPDPAVLAPDLPAGLSDVIAMALAKRPEDRYPSAAALGRDLAAATSGSAISAVGRARSANLRRRLQRGAAALVLVVAAGAGTAWWRSRPRWLDPAELQQRARQLSRAAAEVLNRPDRLLAADAAAAGEVAQRLAALEAQVPPGDPDVPRLAQATARVQALEGLLALARGDLARGEAARDALGDAAVEPASDALRGAVAAVSGEGDPEQAVRQLARALARGVDRPELHGWRARLRVRAGLANAQADEVLTDLALLARARGGELAPDERELAAWAHLAKGDEPAAQAQLAAIADPSPELQWAVSLAVTAPRLEDDPAAVAEALGALPPLPAPAPATVEAAARVDELLRREAAECEAVQRSGGETKPLEQLKLEQTAIDARIAARLTIRELLLPGQPLPRDLADALVHATVGVIKRYLSQPGLEVAVRIAAQFPDVKAMQNTVAAKIQTGESAAHKLLFLPAVRRSIALAGAEEERRELDGLLLESLTAVAASTSPACKRCADEALPHAEAMLAVEVDDARRAWILGERATVLLAMGRLEAALGAVDQAVGLNDASAQLRLLRARILSRLGRQPRQVLDDAAAFLQEQIDASYDADRAARLLWDTALAQQRPGAAQLAAEHAVRLRPYLPSWHYRLAWLLDRRGAPQDEVTDRIRRGDRTRIELGAGSSRYLAADGREVAEALRAALDRDPASARALLSELYAGLGAEVKAGAEQGDEARRQAWEQARRTEPR